MSLKNNFEIKSHNETEVVFKGDPGKGLAELTIRCFPKHEIDRIRARQAMRIKQHRSLQFKKVRKNVTRAFSFIFGG